jgi:hypothetical protein
VLKFAGDILSEGSSVRLSAGETTTVLETLKAEKNVALEALTIVGDRLAGALGRKKDETKDCLFGSLEFEQLSELLPVGML